jgi:ABC-type Mn2+/Zn2+ transport system ATPase subunit
MKRAPIYPHVRHDPAAPILAVEKLTVLYHGQLALQEVSFQVQPGEHIAVVGPNGAGKSTLFKVAAGVLPPTSGEVRVSGFRPGGHICIAYVPQRSQVDWRFPASVSDVVMMGRVGQVGLFRWPERRDWQAVEQALETVGLSDIARRPIGELSGGQQQRAFLARALAQQAELILMDEPLNGLDLPSQEAILGLLHDLRARHVTVLVATHDLDQAADHFDRILLLNRRLVHIGPARTALTPEHLLRAYGAHARLVPNPDGTTTLADTCCDGEADHD